MSQSCFNFSLNENKRIAEDFGEIETQKLIELYFPDKNPASYNEFISNDKVKEALGLKGITEANKLLNTNYKKEISNQQLINLKSIISQTNNKLKGENKNIVYKLYNVKQLGESDNYTWGIREIKGNLDVDAKIERALTRGKTEQAKNLKNLNDNNQLTLFQLPNKQIIKPGVEELFDSNPELANKVYEALGFGINKLTSKIKHPSFNTQKEYYLAKNISSLLIDIVKFTTDDDTKVLAKSILEIPNIDKIKLNVTKYNKETKGIIISAPDALGTYNSFSNLINVIGTLDKESFERVFLHEVIHGITVNEYYSNKEFSNKINKLYNYTLKFKDYRTSKGVTLGEMYGMLNAEEFMSEAMTNPDFIYELSKYYSPSQEKLKEKSIFQEFIDLIVDLIKTKIESRGKKYIENNLGTTVLNTISNYSKVNFNKFNSIFKSEFITPQQKQQALQLYSAYLDSIFPDSKVKDIVYHGANEPIEGGKFIKRLGATGGAIWFSGSKKYATNVMNRAPQSESLMGRKLRGAPTMYQVILNIKNPAHFYESSGALLAQSSERFLEGKIESYRLHGNKQYDKNVNDGALFHHPGSKKPADRDSAEQVVVFEPEQIHILGNKQDIEGFKEFVNSNKLFQLPSNVVNAGLKSVDILSSDKAKQVFAKGEKNKWDLNKILTELGIPKEQKQLIIDSGKTDREEIITDLLANYSYTIEINTAKTKDLSQFNQEYNEHTRVFEYDGFEYRLDDYYAEESGIVYEKAPLNDLNNSVSITEQEFNQAANSAGFNKKEDIPTQYYSNLTVPGGTNYTENEIATPAITPSIKGHAQFATEKGIGWFRSDEVGTNFKEYTYEEAERIHGIVDSTTPTGQFYSGSKTRRILEVQSDLFQRGRDKSDLIAGTKDTKDEFDDEYQTYTINGIRYTADLYEKRYQKFEPGYSGQLITKEEFEKNIPNKKNTSENKFLQLLNKNNNWVTFFVKSIIQDSAKKGYEKVLFPSGDTASKVEGHTTLEEFKKQKENRIKELEEIRKGKDDTTLEYYDEDGRETKTFNTLQEAQNYSSRNSGWQFVDRTFMSIDNEIVQLKQELERVEGPEGFGALKPIYNFYENTVANVLKKQGFNPVLITDEYGNTWNEVEIKAEDLNKILFQLEPTIQKDPTEIIQQVDTLLNDYINNNNIKVEFKDRVLDDNGNDVVAFYNSVKKVIEINQNQRDSKTLPEELAHHLHLALGLDHTLVKRALNLISKVNYKKMLGQDYVQAYDNNDTLLKLELLGKLTAAAVRGETIPVELNNETGNKIWDTIKRMIDAVIRLFKPDTNIQKQLDNLSTEFANMLKSGTKVSSEPTIKTKLYQKNKNLIQLNSKVKPAYVYYTTLLTALKKRQKQFNPLSQEYKMIENQINTVDVALKELITNENELPLIKLVDETIIEVAQGINDFELNFAKGILPSEEELIKYISTLKSFSGFPGVETDVNKLKARLSNFIKSYLINKSSQVLGKEFTEEEVFAITNDVNVLEKNFGTLARTEFTLSRMLGLLIKQKQNTIERENKEAFENIQKATNKLKDWAASNGMTLEQTFDILQQEYRGTRILTKEYTSEFYKLINDTFKLDSEKGKQERAKIATYDDQNKKWIPKSTKYYNPNYQLIHKKGNEALLEYYNFFKKAVQNISDNVLPIELDDYFIPNVYEETLLDILKTQDSVGDKLKDSILHILEFNPFEKMGTIDNQLDVIYDADLIGDKIPLKYIQALPEDKKSKNLSAALLKFMYFANSYKHMSEILPIANLVEESITDPDAFKILQYGNPKLNVAAKSNIVEMVKTIKEMQILGKMRKEDEILNVLGFKMQYGKLIEFGLQYTSKIRLGLNPFAAVANIVIGNLGNIIEAAGGKYFTIGEYFNAVGTFHSESKKVDGLTNVFNPLMEMEDYENLKKLGVGSKEYREKINSLLYLPTRIGERQMQTSTMIAILKHQKIEVKDKNGKVVDKIPMWEAFDNEGKWDAKKMGYTISEQEINKITNRVHGVNQMIHGRYSAKDAAAIQQQALFRALMQFKKWIPAAVEQRFMAKRYDPLLGEETEGRYWAYAKGLRFMMAKLKNDIKKLEENKFTELDWYNMRRNAMELTMIGLLYGLSIFLKAGDDDDELKRNAGYKTYMRLLNSASGDMMQWYLPGTFFDKAMVIPATKTLRSIERTIQYTPYMFGDYSSDASGTYKTGERKDENKFWSNFFSLVPFGSSTSDMYRTWYKDDVSYVQRNR